MHRELDGTTTDREPGRTNDDFIMEEIIIFNECFNAESKYIHLYRSKDTGVWAAGAGHTGENIQQYRIIGKQ